MDSFSFSSLPIIDAHVHFVHPPRLDEMLSLLESAGCKGANLVSLPERGGSNQNAAAAYFKERYPERIYMCGALEYAPALAYPERAAYLLAEQVLLLKQHGFDGLKLIEGKPEVRKLLPHPLDGPLYARMWSALEQNQFPVVLHVGDPDQFWSAEDCPEWARQSGWDYSDGSYPSREDLYDEVEHILARHPGLQVTFAHFYFLSADLERAARFLDAHPGACFDLAPHLGMYRDFTRQPDAARDFFIRYQDRILYGTDLDTRHLERSPEGHTFMQSIPRLIRSTLEREAEFQTASGQIYHGLGLPEAALEKIYASNFERIYGTHPAHLSPLSEAAP